MRFSTILAVLLGTFIHTAPLLAANNIIKLDYPGFTIWLDCDERGPVKFQYNAQRDNGNEKRLSQFYLDPKAPLYCQQKSNKTYKQKGERYDRGHLVPANHMDFSKESIKVSNYMTNVAPQQANMNRGAWLLTEEIIECYRDIDELLIIGGVIYGDDTQDDFFVKSHGIRTPSAFWKVIIRNDRVISWIVPNSKEATRKNLDNYLVSVDDIEKLTGELIPVEAYLKEMKATSSWQLPKGCNKG